MTSTRPEVLCVGAANLDTIALIDRPVRRDGRIVADEIIEAGGGPAATAAVTLARLGIPVGFCGVVGDDDAGRRVVGLLESEGVDASWVRVDPDERTATSVILVQRGTGERSIITRPAPLPRPDDVPVDAADWVHVDHSGWAPVHERGTRARISIDGGNPIDGLTLDGVALYSPTVSALLTRYPGSTPAAALVSARSDGAELVVATDGAAGCLVLDDVGERRIPAFPVEVASTLGAGDVFHGALLAALILGRDADDAVRFANAVAGISCRALDGRSGIPSLDETEAFLAA